jgi:DNA-directed RNA polymerase subunit omega
MDRMPEKIDSKFRFVLLAAERAEQMLRGARPKLDIPDKKATRIAMHEIANDLVEWEFGPAPEQVVEEEELVEEAEPAEDTE